MFIDLLIEISEIMNSVILQFIYYVKYGAGENLNNIDELFNIKAYSIVSSIIRRVSKLKKYDKGQK